MAVSAAISIAAAVVGAVILVKLPPDYFRRPRREIRAQRHPVIRRIFRIVKHTLGTLLVAVGVILSLPGIPGPGIVTILLGVMLLDAPEHRAATWLLRRPVVRAGVNELRARFGQPPLL